MFKRVLGAARSLAGRVGLSVGAVCAAGLAAAQTTPSFDTTTIVATITAVATAGAAVGAAYVATKIGIRAWKWITGAA